jgi:hypothetical protein
LCLNCREKVAEITEYNVQTNIEIFKKKTCDRGRERKTEEEKQKEK